MTPLRVAVCFAGSITISSGCGRSTVLAEPPALATEVAAKPPVRAKPTLRRVVATTYFRSETATLLRLWSDGVLEVGTQQEPEKWETMQGIDDGVGIASNRRQACVLHKTGRATCWYGRDWRTRLWSPEVIVGGRQIVARKDDVCVLVADGVTCTEAPEDKVSPTARLRERRDRQRAREAKRHGTAPPVSPSPVSPPNEDPGPPSPSYTTTPVSDIVRIAPNGWGPHGLIARDGRLLIGLDALEPVAGLAPIVDVVMLGRRNYCATDRAGRVWCDTSPRPFKPKLVDGVTDVAQLEAFLDPEYRGNVGFTACARSHSGTIRCWGSNALGRLGAGPWGESVQSERGRLVDVPAATSLSMDDGWVCVDTASEGRWCWGDGRRSPSWSMPEGVVVIEGEPVDEIAAGTGALCIRRGRQVQCSTVPSVGRLVTVPGLPPAASFVDNEYDVCVRPVSGNGVCWDDSGLRRGEAPPRTPPGPDLQRGLPWGGSELASVVVGTGTEGEGEYACARSRRGEVRCAHPVRSNNPLSKPGRERWPRIDLPEPAEQQVVIGEGGCARLRSGRVACWGEAVTLVTGHATAVPRPVEMGAPWPALPPPTPFGPTR